MNNEMEVLMDFVEEFSPIYAGFVKEMTYDELFDIVDNIVDEHYQR